MLTIRPLKRSVRDPWTSLLLSAAALISTSSPARAESQAPLPVSVEILAADGTAFAQFPASPGGITERAWLQAERGARYRIRIRNDGDQRVGIVIAVDGRNIISGARSDLRRQEPMYVLEPGVTEAYSGWRRNLQAVNEFYFTDWADSYAEAFGDRSAQGVIAVSVYPERVSWRQRRELDDSAHRDKAGAAVPAADSAASARGESRAAGTGYGERRDEPAMRVAFDAAPDAGKRLFLKYEWPETLFHRGIYCRDGTELAGSAPRRNRFWPDAWSEAGFAPPPPRPGIRR